MYKNRTRNIITYLYILEMENSLNQLKYSAGNDLSFKILQKVEMKINQQRIII